MARARNFKPGFYKNEELAECSIWARFIYPGLWCLADREGRLEDRPKRIKAELLPFDTHDAEPLLVELNKRGFILRYAIDGRRYIQIIAFLKHQNPHHKEAPSTIPKPEVLPALHEAKALGSDPMEQPQKPGQDSGKEAVPRGQNPADSLDLVSDSLNRVSESGIPATAKAPSRAAAIAVLIRNLEKARGKASKVTSIHPLVQEWAGKGITDEQITEAFSIAVADREAAGERAAINAGFLDVFLSKLLNPKQGAPSRVNGHGKPWFIASWSAIVDKGHELGIEQKRDESDADLRWRILTAAGVTADQVRKAESDWKQPA